MGWVKVANAGEVAPDYAEVFSDSGPITDYAKSGAYMLDKYVRGGQNLYAQATGNTGLMEDLAAQQAQAAATQEVVNQRSPKASFMGQFAPAASTAALPGGLLAQIGYGAATSGLEYSEDPAQQGQNAMLGGLLTVGGKYTGDAVAGIINKGKNVATAAKRPALKPEAQRLAERADDLGMHIPPGARQDSLPLQQLDASIKSSPAFSSIAEKSMQANEDVLNKLALEAIGESGDEISPELLGAAARRIGKVYDDVAEGAGDIPLNLSGLADDFTSDGVDLLRKYAKDYPALQNGTVDGKTFSIIRKKLQREIRSLYQRGLGEVAEDMKAFQTALVNDLEKAVPGAADELRTAGRQWRILKAMESGKSVTKGGLNTRSFESQLTKWDKVGYKRGGVMGSDKELGDLYDAVRVSNQFSDVVGNSGTATRSYMNTIMSEPTSIAGAAAMRPLVRKYWESGGSPLYSGLLGVVPDVPIAADLGIGTYRGMYGVDQ